MDWMQFALFAIGTFGMFFWNRSESRNDMRHMDAKLEAFREETSALIRAIQQEMKDFHARLCVIEERNKERK